MLTNVPDAISDSTPESDFTTSSTKAAWKNCAGVLPSIKLIAASLAVNLVPFFFGATFAVGALATGGLTVAALGAGLVATGAGTGTGSGSTTSVPETSSSGRWL